ncbi:MULTISPECIES: Calvin cycle protein CP12 [unclassified Sphaerospermopsis]|uniref:Calvin cycle protein CP12 n=1 Tax=unclassified Sphaerospermopsis TaxID=2646443 RepID=UPI0016815AC5|nr:MULTISPECIES: Calvin cycle protein CP12 [unclassified Sphaerospermopsis]MBD2135484.1 Calvin cycle protein CP12 [Sphaerospermopsis sp. FACHB-1094]MBD2148163.1 Calvin cycle protein CP12 [Sphaerospermopsis sp. FACHB-1194]
MTNTQETTNTIQEKIQAEVEQARVVCDISGSNSAECAAAWDAVEELQAEAAHQRQTKPKNSLEQYCDANPEADECRLYED